MAKMKLLDLELSGNCYKVRLFLSLLQLPYELVPVDFMGGEHKSSAMLAKNPFGEIPVLTDGHLTLRDSQAILLYLARKYGGEGWFPTEATAMAQVVEWLMVAENEVARGPNDARLHDKFGYLIDVQVAREHAERILGILEQRLGDRKWLALCRPTIADVACFPYVALSHEGGVPLTNYPSIRAWIDRIKRLPNFVGMPAL